MQMFLLRIHRNRLYRMLYKNPIFIYIWNRVWCNTWVDTQCVIRTKHWLQWNSGEWESQRVLNYNVNGVQIVRKTHFQLLDVYAYKRKPWNHFPWCFLCVVIVGSNILRQELTNFTETFTACNSSNRKYTRQTTNWKHKTNQSKKRKKTVKKIRRLKRFLTGMSEWMWIHA